MEPTPRFTEMMRAAWQHGTWDLPGVESTAEFGLSRFACLDLAASTFKSVVGWAGGGCGLCAVQEGMHGDAVSGAQNTLRIQTKHHVKTSLLWIKGGVCKRPYAVSGYGNPCAKGNES